MPHIESIDELKILLARAYWIETKFDLRSMLDDFGKRDFDFGNRREGEIFRVILEHEEIAKDLYSRLKNSVKYDIFKNTQLSPDEFTTAMESLIKDEEKHIKIVKPLAEKIMRI